MLKNWCLMLNNVVYGVVLSPFIDCHHPEGILEFVMGEIEEENQVDRVNTNLSKAFDKLNHSLLCFNLSITPEGSMLCWSESYLTDQNERLLV
jgi:hypothetical protein